MSRSKEEYNAYIRQWRATHKESVKNTNRKYYQKNKGWINLSSSNPWFKNKIIDYILSGNESKINMIRRVIRPFKDKVIESIWQ